MYKMRSKYWISIIISIISIAVLLGVIRSNEANLEVYVISRNLSTEEYSKYSPKITSSDIATIKYNKEEKTIYFQASDEYFERNSKNKAKWSSGYQEPYIGKPGGSILLDATSDEMAVLLIDNKIAGVAYFPQPAVSSFFINGLYIQDLGDGLILSCSEGYENQLNQIGKKLVK